MAKPKVQSHIQAHLIVFLLFTMIYAYIDYDKHFETPGTEPTGKLAPLYTSVAIHTLLGDGAGTPKTDTGRLIVMVHVIVTWLLTISTAAHLLA